MDYGVFRYCTGLENVTLSNALESIPAWTFEQTSIKSIEIPNSVKMILFAAFSDCAELSEIKWGNSLEIISDNAFLGTKFSKLKKKMAV